MPIDLSNWFVDEGDKSQQFHRFHGRTIVVPGQNPRVARRTRSFRGICFSAKPVSPRWPFMVMIDEVELGWTGHLRLGITKVNPNTEPDLASSAYTRAGDVVGVYYDLLEPGLAQVHVLVNGQDICPKQDPLQINERDQLFAVVDVFGMTKRVTLIPLKKTVRRLSTICERCILGQVENGLSPWTLPLPTPVKHSIASLYSERHAISV